MKAMTKDQKKAMRAEERQRRAARMKRELGETITRKISLGGAGYLTGLAPGLGPARTSTVFTLAGYAGAVAFGGKIGAACEGIGDAGLSTTMERMGAAKRATLARDHFLRGPMFEASGPGAPEVRQAERRAFVAGRVTGVRDGARAAVGAMRDVGVSDNEASSAAELVQGQVDEAVDGQ